MTIHSHHPFLPPEGERNPLRRFRGRLVAPVSLWTAYAGEQRVGWTVSSLMVADGPEPKVLGLLDPDADLTEALEPSDRTEPSGGTASGETATVVVSLLGWRHRHLPDAFAGLAPAPGGPFRLADWHETPYGPVLADAPGWLAATVLEASPIGWSTLLTARIERVEIGSGDEALLGHLRGRYLPLGP